VPVGEADQALHVLVDHQDRLAARAQRPEAAPDLLAHQRRQPLGRLVEDQQARLGDQGAADREHLLLAAGELVAEVVAPSRRRGNSSKTRPMRSAALLARAAVVEALARHGRGARAARRRSGAPRP
jgi:hypothetical protein